MEFQFKTDGSSKPIDSRIYVGGSHSSSLQEPVQAIAFSSPVFLSRTAMTSIKLPRGFPHEAYLPLYGEVQEDCGRALPCQEFHLFPFHAASPEIESPVP
ncbi:hypothetical protein LA66_00115 [Aureimonas altamirensis]|uniref:Uncharacterized protein n=1 Tax=Aureimonas altamirensis TaxID=370622 RepID=A0A0B1Q703_9HYPH|nr:hypothetical protein LA66_00115 [Aureimonas altamirensis]